ncbi:preprotein translocase subunit YajC [Paramaledivibacter caminithermalis]|uniref:Protein translocase subunit yajC n=1 Tax=Paramaledivibacter caminithermalis (strain DSM 15212 / CIP 107654 / DViRD3) TaxID=1121301 RepID=A0A1M6QUQ5_PARC5|nr:preprotein translocase subunit YajC [Paramaledivibacter caminithermalis]SHK23905.1 protein translocase subunit yajC [Paramaledivibacter caminithermalis DSM 15212]
MQQYSGLIMMIVFFGIFYFLLIRPQQKKNKQIQKMRSELKVGDNIITIGGIHGKILNIKDEIVTLEVGADKVKLQISKWAVGSVKNKSNE